MRQQSQLGLGGQGRNGVVKYLFSKPPICWGLGICFLRTAGAAVEGQLAVGQLAPH